MKLYFSAVDDPHAWATEPGISVASETVWVDNLPPGAERALWLIGELPYTGFTTHCAGCPCERCMEIRAHVRMDAEFERAMDTTPGVLTKQ